MHPTLSTTLTPASFARGDGGYVPTSLIGCLGKGLKADSNCDYGFCIAAMANCCACFGLLSVAVHLLLVFVCVQKILVALAVHFAEHCIT